MADHGDDHDAESMTATEVLKHEHELVLEVIGAMEREADMIDATGRLDSGDVALMVDFSENFTDGCHHAKEEGALFPRLRERNADMVGPTSAMLEQHETGRRRIRAIAEDLPAATSGDADAIQRISENLHAYAAGLRDHISKENGVLFPMADGLLTTDDQRALSGEFDRVEVEETGRGVHEQYHAMAEELIARSRRD
jgi:hemerythrin-like domain-containing protein